MGGTDFQQKFGEEEPFGGSSVHGSRIWGVDSFGRLVGKFNYVWRPGENKAICKVDQNAASTKFHLYALRDDDIYPPKPRKIGCKGVEPRCTCGFYAYYKRENPPEYGAVGVIEGYGLTTQGRLGFRALKARILAVTLTDTLVCEIPARAHSSMSLYTGPQYSTPSTPEQVHRNYPDVKFFDRVSDMYAEFPPGDAPLFDPEEPGFWEKPIG